MLVVKNLPANAEDLRDVGLIPGLGISLGGGYGNPFQHSCLENSMSLVGYVHRVAKSWTHLKELRRMHTLGAKHHFRFKGYINKVEKQNSYLLDHLHT